MELSARHFFSFALTLIIPLFCDAIEVRSGPNMLVCSRADRVKAKVSMGISKTKFACQNCPSSPSATHQDG
jgi:hypothetical protein